MSRAAMAKEEIEYESDPEEYRGGGLKVLRGGLKSMIPMGDPRVPRRSTRTNTRMRRIMSWMSLRRR
ncbi:hypothetical protein CASFOL_031935 [Castilleja foliolosa]|uniref:Uncharacterized protein n=1 Tax=Castilleja foliolosa TaxID=1961234 RepID=A0ABD3C0Y9_9LAMI